MCCHVTSGRKKHNVAYSHGDAFDLAVRPVQLDFSFNFFSFSWKHNIVVLEEWPKLPHKRATMKSRGGEVVARWLLRGASEDKTSGHPFRAVSCKEWKSETAEINVISGSVMSDVSESLSDHGLRPGLQSSVLLRTMAGPRCSRRNVECE